MQTPFCYRTFRHRKIPISPHVVRYSAPGGAESGHKIRAGKAIPASFIAILMAMTMMAGCGSGSGDSASPSTHYADSIMVYCAASMRPSMEEIGALFQEEYGTRVDFNFGGSGTLLTQIETTQQGDVYVPADSSYIDKLEEKGFAGKSETIAYHVPIIMVPKGNPAGIESLADLAKPGVRVVWGDPEAASIGKVGNQVLEKNGLQDAVWANVIATTATVDHLTVYIEEGQADATLSWSEMGTEGVEMIEIPRDQNIIQLISLASLSFSGNMETAEAFVEFCSSEKGLSVIESYGFKLYPDPEYEE